MKTRSSSRQVLAASAPVLILSNVRIPPDVFIRILSFISRPEAVHTASMVCKGWLAVTRDPSFWQSLDSSNGLGGLSSTIRNTSDLLSLLSRRQFSSLKCLVTPVKLRMPKTAIVFISKACPLLEEIDVGYSIYSEIHITDTNLLALPKLFPRLSKIRLSLKRATNGGIAAFCQRMGRRLLSFRIDDLPSPEERALTDETVFVLAGSCPNLERFDYGCFMYRGNWTEATVSSGGIVALLAGCTSLKSISLLNRISTGLQLFEHMLEMDNLNLDSLFIVGHVDLNEDNDLCLRLAAKVKDFEAISDAEHLKRCYSVFESSYFNVYW